MTKKLKGRKKQYVPKMTQCQGTAFAPRPPMEGTPCQAVSYKKRDHDMRQSWPEGGDDLSLSAWRALSLAASKIFNLSRLLLYNHLRKVEPLNKSTNQKIIRIGQATSQIAIVTRSLQVSAALFGLSAFNLRVISEKSPTNEGEFLNTSTSSQTVANSRNAIP